MLVRFATMGPTPYDDSRRDNGIDGNDQINGFNGGTVDSGELHGKQKGSRHAKAKDVFDEEGRYIIEDYDALPTFSNFLPGVAGIYGKPVRRDFCTAIELSYRNRPASAFSHTLPHLLLCKHTSIGLVLLR